MAEIEELLDVSSSPIPFAVLNINNVLPLTHQHSRQTMTHFCEMLLFCSLIRNDRKPRQHGLKTE